MIPERVTTDPRIGNTQRELGKWIEDHPDDESLRETADFVKRLVTDWRAGVYNSEDALGKLYERYLEAEGEVSEVSSTVLLQATMWFGFEAGITMERDMEIERQLLN